DSNYQISSNWVDQFVNLSDTTTTLVSDPNSSGSGEDVTLTATVSSANGTPTGSVAFMDGSNPIGYANGLSVNPGGTNTCGYYGMGLTNGTVSCTYSFPTRGTYAITAVYSGG